MGKIAPHENCEVRLVLGGKKPLAAIERDKDPYGYSMAIALGNAGTLRHVLVAPGEVVIVRSCNLHILADYLNLLQNGVATYGIKEYHRRMGAFFGYTPEDIKAFIDAEIHCECSKCTGVTWIQ